MKKIFFVFLLQAVFILSGQAQVLIHFQSNEYKLSEEEIPALLALIDSLKDKSVEKIIIAGYTDNTGDEAFNLDLSEKRATAVKDFFTDHRIDLNKIEVQYFGYNDPIQDNITVEGRQKNRRVEIKYIYAKEEEETLSDINILYERMKDKGSQFCIDPTRDTILVAENGSMIAIPANTFSLTNQCSCIKIVFHEYFSMKDFILNNLTTTSNEMPMASGGMTRIEAYCGDLPVDFNADSAVTIMVPTATPDSDMGLYTADRDSSNDILNWQTKNKKPEIFTKQFLGGWHDAVDNNNNNGRCRFFFCKIRGFFQNVFHSGRNKYDKAKDKLNEQNAEAIGKLRSFGIKQAQLGEALKVSNIRSKDALSYYVFKSASFSYHNLDKLLSGQRFTPFYVNEKFNENKDIKVILKGSRTVLPAVKHNAIYEIKFLFANTDVTIVGLKYKDGKIFLATKEVNTDVKRSDIEFKEATEVELNEVLNQISKNYRQ